MRVIFMGSPDFSVPALQHLEAHHQIVAVYSQPPKPQQRGHHVQKQAVHLYAEARQLPVFTPQSLRTSEAQAQFKHHQADVAVVVAYGLILPKEILETPRLGCINIHASLLPRWRGAAPIQRAILTGDTETGITIMQMDEGLDTGPMYKTEHTPILSETTLPQLHQTLSQLGAKLIVETLTEIETNNLHPHAQPAAGVCYAHKLTKEEGHLNWQEDAIALARRVRALNPWPGTWFEHKSIPLKVHHATVVENPTKALPGTFLETSSHPWIVTCGTQALALNIIQKPGGRPLPVAEFLKGFSR